MMVMTVAQKKARRRVIVKRIAAAKIKETWRLKREAKANSGKMSDFGDAGVSDIEAALDELPESLLG